MSLAMQRYETWRSQPGLDETLSKELSAMEGDAEKILDSFGCDLAFGTAGLRGVLAQDPRPSYQNDPTRVYRMDFAGCHVSFTVRDNRLTVCALTCDDAADTRSKA